MSAVVEFMSRATTIRSPLCTGSASFNDLFVSKTDLEQIPKEFGLLKLEDSDE